jgi:hypothetical protein
MLGGSNAQALFESRIEIADRQGGHRCLVQLRAIVVLDECGDCKSGGLRCG